ncbi:polysaccharide pyruvyl transferase CsaB [Salsuginibacillus halophilus]|uniref:Polysaccharide pyruvyl transferase CsaB n=1 Tax=Salsuginibacillus halophilus TaxID=517424 RepID=A0A2P8HQN2_9BACI|nr:polysaccharide pyruvyl transferase CsaB [Salsuginibacillus halophilus]PSL48527.1 polysaccharide pyruvyl transferase CsaB [Salsuginibacillus halophilus]
MHVVLSGYFGFKNEGDEAILRSVVEALRREDPEITITALSNDPEETEKTHGIKAVNRWHGPSVYRALKQADGLISGGGSLLQDQTGPKTPVYYTGVMHMARFLRKPVVIYAQGLGPLSTKLGRRVSKAGLKRAALLSVRDEGSKKLLGELGVKQEAVVVPDPVLGMTPDPDKRPFSLNSNQPYTAVSVRPWPAVTSDSWQALAKGLDQIAERGSRIVFVPMHGEEDANASEQVKQLMTYDAEVLAHDETLEGKMAAFAGAEQVVGMRLHALIFAACGHTPFAALSYDPKVEVFAALANQPVAADMNEPIRQETVKEVFADIQANQQSYGAHVKAYAEEAKQEVQQLAAQALQTLR